MTNYTRKFQSKRCARFTILAAALTTTLAATLLLSSMVQEAEGASARVNMHQVSRQTNQCKYTI